MPWYRREGKLENPITDQEFQEGMETGHFVHRAHRSYCILLYYTGIRNGEALKATREQFRMIPNTLLFDVGERLKHSKKTPALPLSLSLPYMNELEDTALSTAKGKRIFPFTTTRTGYNIVRRVWKYPHWFRLSRITYFFMPHPEVGRPQGFSIAEVRSWTGLSLKALDYYVGLVNIEKMGQALRGSNTN